MSDPAGHVLRGEEEEEEEEWGRRGGEKEKVEGEGRSRGDE